MMLMDELKDKVFKLLRLDNLVEHLSGYLETRLELFKLEVREDVAKVLSKAIVYLMMAFFGILFLIFFSIGAAQLLNAFFPGGYAGYWIVAGIYGVAFLIFIVFKKSIDRSFEKHFMEMIRSKQK
jgi:hypothetical protein